MVVFYNPHVDDFLAEPLQFRILRRRALKKYGFMIEEARRDGKIVKILVDGTSSGIIPERIFQCLPHLIRYGFAKLECWFWKKLNKFGSEVQAVFLQKSMVDDVLLVFSYKAATGRFDLREKNFLKFKSVVFHLSHYFVDTGEKARNISKLPNAHLAGDSDISNIDYFKRFFDWYNKPFLVLPFAVARRFSNKQPWTSRDSRVVATGSFHDLRFEQPARRYKDFIGATGSTTYHPVRKALFEKREHNTWVNCNVNLYRDYSQSSFARLLSRFRVAQKQYFSINIVDLYNKHRYAVVGEELSGFPALGAFEAMACGCLVFAQPEYYIGLGLLPHKHFIAYDGKVESMQRIMQQLDRSDLTQMSIDVSDFVTLMFSEPKVYNMWINTLHSIQ